MTVEFSEYIAALGSNDFMGDPKTVKAIEEGSIRGLTAAEINKVFDAFAGALVRTDAWTNNRELSAEISRRGGKFFKAVQLIRSAQSNHFKTLD